MGYLNIIILDQFKNNLILTNVIFLKMQVVKWTLYGQGKDDCEIYAISA